MANSSEKIRHILDSLDRITQNKPGPTASTSTSNNAEQYQIWAKGTGYGVGAYSYSYDAASASSPKGNAEEEKVTSLLKSLKTELDKGCGEGVDVLLKNSCLISVVSAYLRNNSVLDIANHVPLYSVILQLLRSIAADKKLWFLLESGEGDWTISKLLVQLNGTVRNYSQLLKASKAKDLDLSKLISDVRVTAAKVEESVKGFLNGKHEDPREVNTEDLAVVEDGQSTIAPVKTLEERYIEEMKQLQFAFMEMIGTGQVFKVPYHFQAEARKNWAETGQRITSRAKRLAQESIVLSTSLPLSHGSSIFVRCDNDRLDVLKVLITGPAGTPYSNGCFEFDVHFPLDYPNSPPMVQFMTTGGNRVRFNPNLYECGKVCLTILNTWFGSPEEQWNPKTSSLLPVLVAIQSMIFVENPYFNEPAYQELSGSEVETSSRIYNANIRSYTLQYAILEQMRNPTGCFKEIIQRHFWMKREEILRQCEEWKVNAYGMFYTFEQTITALKWEFRQMSPPKDLKEGGNDLVQEKQTIIALEWEFRQMSPTKGLEDLKEGGNDSVQEKQPATMVEKKFLKASPTDASAVQKSKGKKKGVKKASKGQCCLQ